MNQAGDEDTHRTIERVARESYGRLLARLAAHTRDVASAEDVLGDALVAALTTWPRDGVPRSPEAWLVTTARHFFIDRVRHEQVSQAHQSVLMAAGSVPNDVDLPPDFPDERLKLLFVCAHPAIDPAMHTPLMLQTVLGLDAARIAQAFLVSPSTMGQRLVRVKTKIRVAGIPFAVPPPDELPRRLDAVLEAIYAAFGIGWSAVAGIDERGRDLAEEAIWLARVLLELMPEDAEVLGLLSLMLHSEARRPARRAPDGRYVPLSEQDPRLWSLGAIEEAERSLARAAAHGRAGRFQLEAAIQSVHNERVRGRTTDWAAIVLFYE
ncbi:MAG: RNA polymerase sigma factor, partial [Gemmatimonadaceae bacterium]